jgi:integrase
MASIHQHRNRWRVKWRDADGRQLVTSHATKAEAELAARKVEALTVVDGAPPTLTVDPDTMTVAKWWARWEPGRPWAASSRATHRIHWRKYIAPVFGRLPLERVKTADVERWHRKLEARGLAPRTVAAIHRTLSMSLQGAVKDGFIPRNPAADARLPQPAKTPPVALDTTTVAALCDAITETTPELDAFARVIAATGLRRAEAAGLTWDRVDLEHEVLTVDRQLDYSARLPAWCSPKTRRARRVLLTPATAALLRAHRAAQPVVAIKDALVFTRTDGKPWPSTTLERAWHRAADLLDEHGTPLPAGARGWHTLRHTVASRLLEAGVPVAEAAELLGHSPEMLLATYAHVTDRSAADARLRAALALDG